jgi:hypothetical protein
MPVITLRNGAVLSEFADTLASKLTDEQFERLKLSVIRSIGHLSRYSRHMAYVNMAECASAHRAMSSLCDVNAELCGFPVLSIPDDYEIDNG